MWYHYNRKIESGEPSRGQTREGFLYARKEAVMPHKPKRPCRWPGCSEQIAVEMDFRVRHVYEVHNDALKKVEEILSAQ